MGRGGGREGKGARERWTPSDIFAVFSPFSSCFSPFFFPFSFADRRAYTRGLFWLREAHHARRAFSVRVPRTEHGIGNQLRGIIIQPVSLRERSIAPLAIHDDVGGGGGDNDDDDDDDEDGESYRDAAD